MPESRREFYRITYPLAERPAFVLGRFVHQVVDCSEKGLRYSVKDRRVPPVGTMVGGIVQFRRGDEIEVSGEVIRTRGGTVVLALNPPMPFAEILAEQRYLRAKGYTLRD